MPLPCIDTRAPTNQKHNIAQNCPAIRHLACSSSLALLLTLFIANFHNNMRQELLDAYWDVVREGLTFKEAADGRGVNRGTLCRIFLQRHCSSEESSIDTTKGGSLIDFD